jgi:hypothetical protein
VRSVADDLRVAVAARVRAMSPDERLALTDQLARDDLELFLSAHASLDERTTRRLLERRRQAGRRQSRAMEEILE